MNFYRNIKINVSEIFSCNCITVFPRECLSQKTSHHCPRTYIECLLYYALDASAYIRWRRATLHNTVAAMHIQQQCVWQRRWAMSSRRRCETIRYASEWNEWTGRGVNGTSHPTNMNCRLYLVDCPFALLNCQFTHTN